MYGFKYYHHDISTKQIFMGKKPTANAYLYDIREHFQSRKENGKMNSKSDDKKYRKLIGNLRNSLKILAKK